MFQMFIAFNLSLLLEREVHYRETQQKSRNKVDGFYNKSDLDVGLKVEEEPAYRPFVPINQSYKKKFARIPEEIRQEHFGSNIGNHE